MLADEKDWRNDMDFKKFKNGTEMYEYLCTGRDLYSKRCGIYAFEYNDAHAICIYHLQPDEIAKLIEKSNETGEYWGAHLGCGGNILEEPNYNDEEHRYHKEEAIRNLYLGPSLEFCNNTFSIEDWLDTDDVTEEYVIPKTTEMNFKTMCESLKTKEKDIHIGR